MTVRSQGRRLGPWRSAAVAIAAYVGARGHRALADLSAWYADQNEHARTAHQSAATSEQANALAGT